jgi:hypothetical protein
MPLAGFEPTIPVFERAKALRPRGHCDRPQVLITHIGLACANCVATSVRLSQHIRNEFKAKLSGMSEAWSASLRPEFSNRKEKLYYLVRARRQITFLEIQIL